ncbi:glycine-rich RNA-binding protein 3, mitochondrial-like [Rhododendron vialii]|uniref:glycine-rich RNA-binding protein 3, mitochondrial-like n=1 Tax=Rhododendron vialii TaxID=182163 RepID=UPI00265F37E7|nr:glycine-rich RNA-binding protein 3, mitochondrial-like [Rhododendron vialii]
MAFVSKVGYMLKQTISNHVKLELAASKPSIYQAIRCMSSSKLFVGGIPYSTDEMSLRETFAQYGEVVEARIVTDRETGRSRGFAFVSYTSSDEASGAIQALDGKDFQGRMVRVNYAVEKSRTGGFGSGGSYSGSNYGASGDYGSGGTSFTSNDGNYTGGGSGYGDSNYGNSGGVNSLGSRSYGGTTSFGGEDSGGYDGTTGTTFGNPGRRVGNKDFNRDVIEENNEVDNDEVDDYANTRG